MAFQYTTGIMVPNSAANYASQVRPDWSNPTSAVRRDGSSASNAPGAGPDVAGDYLGVYNYKLAVPTGVTITKVAATLNCYGTGTGRFTAVVLGDTTVGTAIGMSTKEASAPTGSLTDLVIEWGAGELGTLTPATCNTTNFGLRVRAINDDTTSRTFYVDVVELEITYESETPLVFFPTISVGTGVSGQVGGLTVNWPSGHQAGDIGILVVTGDPQNTPDTEVSGWNKHPSSPRTSGTGTLGVTGQLYWRVATSDAEAPAVFSVVNTSLWGVIFTIRGCDPSASPPWDATNAWQANAEYTNVPLPTLTTTKDKCLLVAVGQWATDSAGPFYSGWSFGGTMTEVYDAGTTTGNGGGVGIATREKETAGAVAQGTVTAANTYHTTWTLAFAGWTAPVGAHGLFWGNNF
jgi:hypothetical protein